MKTPVKWRMRCSALGTVLECSFDGGFTWGQHTACPPVIGAVVSVPMPDAPEPDAPEPDAPEPDAPEPETRDVSMGTRVPPHKPCHLCPHDGHCPHAPQ